MFDKTTEGHTATDAEVEGMLRNLCAYALSDPEPLRRYLDLTHQQVVFDGVVAAIRRERGKALADLAAMGIQVAKVAELAKLESPAQVKSLVAGAGRNLPAAGRAASKKAPAQRGAAPRKAAGSSGDAGRMGVPMLPVSIVPAGKRTLTADERRSLGLSDATALTGEEVARQALSSRRR